MGADTSSLKGTAKNEQLQWLSNLSPGYVTKLKEKFEYASDDFTLDKAALKQYFKCSDRECKFLFDHFDQDGNGKIDSYEFVCGMALLSHGTLEDKAELIFGLYDFDGNKYISRDELVILMTNVLSSMKALKKQAPPRMADIEAKTDEFFRKADLDGDQRITLKEFKQYITNDKQILEILLDSNMANREDIGTDFGPGGSVAPDCDRDLELECNPKGLDQSDKKQNMRDGNNATEMEGFEVEDVGGGDQFMAVKPWIGVIKNSVPSKYKPSPRDSEAPDATLQLEYIHGYRCHDARNNLRYTATGEIVFHAAAVGIVLNQKTNTQRFLIEHNDDILCLAVDPSGKYCATGQIGPKPQILIWDNETMQVKTRIQGTLLKGIKNLAFSPNGQYLAASAFDDDHSIAVYSWNSVLKPGETLKPIASGKGVKAMILSLAFNPDSNILVATCLKEVAFFSFTGGLIKCKKGTGWDNNAQGVLCQAYLGPTLYTGLFDGTIGIWTGTAIKGFMKAHTDGCHALFARPNNQGLISGGGDGLIILWAAGPTGLTQTKQFDLKVPEIKSMIPKARSVCENPTTGTILVGTRGGEIVEFGGTKPLVYLRSHHTDELWGLATHPTKDEFITVGQDNFMAIWDIKTRKQKRFGKLEQAANVAEYSRNGSMLAIGYTNGTFHVLMLDEGFAMRANKKDRKEAISEIKFSPNDSILAVGAHDSLIITYDVKNNFALLKKIKKNLSTVSHFDFSLDGQCLMSNSTSYEILFFDVASGNQITGGASQLKDETWSTYTCHLGWGVQGIWPPLADGSDINAVDRSPENLVTATADDFGMVKLFKFPSPVDRAAFQEYRGHSSHVTNVRFMKSSPYLISTGGEDKCIFQWKYCFDKESAAQTKKGAPQVDTSNIMNDIAGPSLNSKQQTLQTQKTLAFKKQETQLDEEGFEMEDAGEGDQRLAVLPFKGQVDKSKPTGWKDPPKGNQKPDGNLHLRYAHGFRSFDTRHNLKYINKDDIVFSTAALGVVLNKPKNTQTFFNQHAEDIVSLAIHPSKDIVATGQMAQIGKSKVIDIFVWRISNMQLLAQLNNFHKGAIRRLEFSPAGDKLLTIGEDDQNSVAIYDWANKKMICKSGIDPDKVFDAAWANENEFATVGMKCIKFFTIQGINLTGQKGLLGTGVVPISCHYAFAEKTFLTGSSNGDLVQWNGRSIGKTYKRHTDALWCIQTITNGQMIVTGANDGKVIIWDKTLTVKQTIDLVPMSKFPVGVRSIDYHEQAKTYLIGTRGSEIIEVSATGQKIKTLINGHFQGCKVPEVWGCAVHPKEQLFASCGADATIRIWNSSQMLKASDPFKDDLTALDWSSDGKFLVAGDRLGFIHLVDAVTLQELATVGSSLVGKSDNAWVEDVKISPNNKLVVFGSHGGLSKLEIVEILDGGKKLRQIKAADVKMSSALTHLDWSADSQFVVINSQGYELMFIDVNNKKQINASSAKDIMWQTWTCILGFPVQGIWPAFSDFTDVNSVCRSNSQKVLATSEDQGLVKLFKYPSTIEKAQFNSYTGHSSHVTKVKFTAGDQFVITTGGNDKTVIVWETDFGFGFDEEGEGSGTQQYQIEDDKNEVEDEEIDDDDFKLTMKDPAKTQKLLAKQKTLMSKTPKKVIEDDNPFEEDDVGAGDESLATVPWKSQSVAPTGWKRAPVNQNKPPTVNLDLDWVHGYRSRDARNNIGLLLDGSIAYQAAAVGVAYDPSAHTQRFFIQHTDDVTAIAFSPDRTLVVTGEVGPKPAIHVWDGITMQLKFTLQHKLTKGIQALSFSPSGKTIAAVAVDNDHSVAAFNAETGVCIGTNKGDVAQILDISMKDDTTFSTAGVKHYAVWTAASNNLTSKKGTFGDKDPKHATCAYSGDFCLTGSITGEVYVWSGTSIKQSLKNHTALVESIHVTKNYIFTGGKDLKVNILSPGTFAQLFSFSIDEQQWQSVCGRVKAMCLNEESKVLYLGTLGSEIYQVKIDFAKKQVSQPKVLVNGHYSPSLKDNNEVWGLNIIPNKEMYITVSDDCTLRVWDSNSKRQIKCVSFLNDEAGIPYPEDPATKEPSNACKGRTVDVSLDGKTCAVGFRDGSVRIYNTSDWKMTKRWQLAKKLIIQDLKFSPDGKYLAVSSHDMKIYIYENGNFDKKPMMCGASTAGVTHLDWSVDSKSLHTNDLSYELLFYNAVTGVQDKRGSTNFKDEHWATWTLPHGWTVQGIWPPLTDGSDINAVDRSNKKTPDDYYLVASADDKSLVKLFRYPCVDVGSKPFEGKGHSSHVTAVRFSKDDKYLFSAGGNDTCIFQWRVASTQ